MPLLSFNSYSSIISAATCSGGRHCSPSFSSSSFSSASALSFFCKCTHISAILRSNFTPNCSKSTARFLFFLDDSSSSELPASREHANSAAVKSSSVSRAHIRSLSRRNLLYCTLPLSSSFVTATVSKGVLLATLLPMCRFLLVLGLVVNEYLCCTFDGLCCVTTPNPCANPIVYRISNCSAGCAFGPFIVALMGDTPICIPR
mmetsp:Transcript_7741/g.11430  ORF Transcript_7741/g.11430 Transcript_7741/m.11430 type:complete len:203 (+) Transcript_7741:1690-2298(+)